VRARGKIEEDEFWLEEIFIIRTKNRILGKCRLF